MNSKKRYQFEFDGSADQMENLFLETLTRCIYEDKHGKSYTDEDEEIMQSFVK